MDIHPSGFPGLVGPEGGDFSHFDFSSQFRVLPNNGPVDMSCPNQEKVAMRSHQQSLHLQAAPSNNNVTPLLSQPLQIRDNSGKNHSGNGGKLVSPRSRHLLTEPVPPLVNSLVHSLSRPAVVIPREVANTDIGELPVSTSLDQNRDSADLGF
ncbi:hypothetical protein KP509_12G067000 [Ceratopteris richardii]|uniref:Uncharacterized protein n=1 Tax=Ceratopteris richardii TaxID=49495 RepID=A0A8T2TLU5_CERRI|nr:hypothetical protein KP509_12G067000 [Ceratopteris richardii]KAH7423663.1 hypothetical protein KP509_12G067000 [Ceratopteris richardii]